MSVCTHADMLREVAPSADGCEDCLRTGGWWIHLRMCLTCGHVGCCESSPSRHASGHAREAGHPLARPLGTGETWVWCFADDVELEVAPPGPRRGAGP